MDVLTTTYTKRNTRRNVGRPLRNYSEMKQNKLGLEQGTQWAISIGYERKKCIGDKVSEKKGVIILSELDKTFVRRLEESGKRVQVAERRISQIEKNDMMGKRNGHSENRER